jgi:spore photoproduct lyase
MQEDLFDAKKEPTVTKHRLLESYLRPWAKIIGSHFPHAWYVDGFAGTGIYKTGEEGSPLIAARILLEERCRLLRERQKECTFHVICIERHVDRARTLQQSAGQLSERIPFTVLQGEFTKRLAEVLELVGARPGFFFLDPAGFAGLPMTRVREIVDFPHKEVLINFMWNAIRRWARTPTLRRTVTRLMGTDAWQECRSEREWLDLYISQLKNAGCYVWAFRNKFREKKTTFYYLVYATKDLHGFKIMKDVMFKEDTRQYFEPDLFERIEFSDFVNELEGRIRRAGAAHRRQLLEFTLSETQYLDKHLRKALGQLEAAGRIVKHGTGEAAIYRAVSPSAERGNPSSVRERAVAYRRPLAKAGAVASVRGIRIVYADYRCQDGSRRRLVRQVGDGSIIKRFDRTPFPREERDVVCPHFLELKWAYGCPYDCAWCYLKGTLRFSPRGAKPTIKNLEKVRRHTTAFLEADSEPEILNTGEIADSLMYEAGRHSFARFILELFEAQDRHKVLFLSKSDRIQNLLAASSHAQAIVSFSLNAFEVGDRWEVGAPPVLDRIKAAKALFDEGYEVRVRIDPLVPVPGWREGYGRLLGEIFANFRPARITLGSLRGLQSTINNCPDKSWVTYLSDTSRWGRRVDLGLRCEMFATLIEALRRQYDYAEVGLCKETVGVWRALGMDSRRIRCNCIL